MLESQLVLPSNVIYLTVVLANNTWTLILSIGGYNGWPCRFRLSIMYFVVLEILSLFETAFEIAFEHVF